MVSVVYIEEAVRDHPRVEAILQRLPKNKHLVYCDNYREIFNRKAQSFRLQKQDPALILARKEGNKVLATPEGFGIGGEENFYFSHMLNCLYDCRYCFLQGMYRSANYVLFVNYEDFMDELAATIQAVGNSRRYFFSGYDCDSLAMEHITGFLKEFLPFFAKHPQATLELRTKSTNVRELLRQQPLPNVVVAFSFTPEVISQAVEYKVPALDKRLRAMQQVAEQGWQIGLRFDPIIYASNYKLLYKELTESVFAHVQAHQVHSVSVGPMRFPEKMYQHIQKLYPQEKLLAQPLHKRGELYSYQQDVEQAMKQFVKATVANYLSESTIFECNAL